MNTIKIKLADGTARDFTRGKPAREFLAVVDAPDSKNFIAVLLNGKPVDLSTPLEEDSELRPIRITDKEGIEILRHSASHVMAQAVRQLFPGVKIAIGPAIEDGFYYDFEYEKSFTPEDLSAIEKRMDEIIKSNEPFTRLEDSRDEAIRRFKGQVEGYKVEILNEITDPKISLYQVGDFVDLCRGPHLPSTGWIKAFKLTSLAGAYWRGDEKRQMLQRIYGTAFPTREELEKYLQRVEEAKLRDHRKLGKELGLFSIEEDIGPGLVLWHPKGAAVRMVIEDFWRKEHIKRGYQILYTPHVARIKLWDKSGHTGFYRENMFSPMDVEGMPYLVKPMNCPFHIYVYKNQIRSYRELPIRYAELGTVYRYERSGVLHGLLRVRGFTQDDAHIFLTEEQSEQEIADLLNFTVGMLNQFGFSDFEMFLSTRPEKSVGSTEAWEKATNYLISGLKKMGLKYTIDPGAGVFYGPKIDIKIRDSLGRTWQCSTLQVDFNLPERFGMEYISEDGKAHQPIMIHRALMGSLERFFGCLIEHYKGDFPLWLAPVQMRVIAINERNNAYGSRVWEELLGRGIRVEHDFRREKLSYKIREAELEKIKYSIIVGDKEEKAGEISPRGRRGELGKAMKISEFLESIAAELSSPQRKGGVYQTGS